MPSLFPRYIFSRVFPRFAFAAPLALALLAAGCGQKQTSQAVPAPPSPAVPSPAAPSPTAPSPSAALPPADAPLLDQNGNPPPPLAAGTRAPAFSVKTTTGKTLTLASLRGQVVLMDYWATWCVPCRRATPTLQAFHKSFGPQGLQVIGMSVDDVHSVSQVKPFIKKFGVTYAITTTPDANQKAASAYQADIFPSQYLIDKKGVVRWSQAGYSPEDKPMLTALIKNLLAEKG